MKNGIPDDGLENYSLLHSLWGAKQVKMPLIDAPPFYLKFQVPTWDSNIINSNK